VNPLMTLVILPTPPIEQTTNSAQRPVRRYAARSEATLAAVRELAPTLDECACVSAVRVDAALAQAPASIASTARWVGHPPLSILLGASAARQRWTWLALIDRLDAAGRLVVIDDGHSDPDATEAVKRAHARGIAVEVQYVAR
jgi:hypothetical protein